MIVRQFTVGPLQENCFLVADEETRQAVLIDPGDEPDRLLAAVRDAGVSLDAIWLTHAHMDHVGAIAGIRRAFPAPIHLHPLDRPLYDRAAQQGAAYGLRIEQPPPPDAALTHDQALPLGSLEFSVMHAPGHSPGLVVIHGNGVAFVGDLLFAGSIGRTDLPLSSPSAMSRSLLRLCKLAPETIVYPGHGPETTLAAELVSNPFLNGVARVRTGE